MSHSKFAPITSALLIRKGEASPSPHAVQPAVVAAPAAAAPVSRPVIWLNEMQRRKQTDFAEPRPEPRYVYTPDESASTQDHKNDNEKSRRIVLNLTAHEYETLGLVAVKKNTTRHQLAQAALDAYFEWLVAEYGEACNCIVGGALCRCECSH